MNINDLMSDLGIPSEPENKRESAPQSPAKPPKRAKRPRTPKRPSKRSQRSRIERLHSERCHGMEINILNIGKVFDAGLEALANDPSISDAALGDVVFAAARAYQENAEGPESVAARADFEPAANPLLDPWQRLMSLAPASVGCQFKHGISRYGKPYAFWKIPGEGKPVNLNADTKAAWEACQGPNLQEVISRAWRLANTARAEGYNLSAGTVQDLKDAYREARIQDRKLRDGESPSEPLRAPETPAASETPSEPQTALSEPEKAPQVATLPQVRELPDILEVERQELDTLQLFDACYLQFRQTRDVGDAAELQRAMTRMIQEAN